MSFIRLFGKKSSRDQVRDGLGEVAPRLWRYCVMLTGSRDLADDLAQAACARALEKADQFEPDSQLRAWVFRIAQRLWLNDRRAEAVRRGNGVVSVVDFELIDPSPSAETNIFATEVLSKVAALPEAQREAVMLVYVEGFAYKEAAEILGIPIGTVMSRLAAARKKLVKELAEEERNEDQARI